LYFFSGTDGVEEDFLIAADEALAVAITAVGILNARVCVFVMNDCF